MYLTSYQVAEGVQAHGGYWKHGHTYQAHPLSCAAALAVQEAIEEEGLLENIRLQGEYLKSRLTQGLKGKNALSAPFVYDIRGAGGFWGVEFDFTGPEAKKLDFKGDRFALLVQSKALENGLNLMGFTGCADLGGVNGDHLVLAPAYNITQVCALICQILCALIIIIGLLRGRSIPS